MKYEQFVTWFHSFAREEHSHALDFDDLNEEEKALYVLFEKLFEYAGVLKFAIGSTS